MTRNTSLYLVIGIVIMSAIDGVLSYIGVKEGLIVEKGPIMGLVINDPVSLSVIKTFLTGVGCAILYKYRAMKTLFVLNIIYILVCTYHIHWILITYL